MLQVHCGLADSAVRPVPVVLEMCWRRVACPVGFFFSALHVGNHLLQVLRPGVSISHMDRVAPQLLDPIRSRRRIEHEATFPFRTDTPGVFMDICVWAPKPPGQGRRPAVTIRRVEQASWTYSCYLCRAENEYSVRDHFANGECRIINQLRRGSDSATRHMREQTAEFRRTGVYPWNRSERSSPPRTRRRLG